MTTSLTTFNDFETSSFFSRPTEIYKFTHGVDNYCFTTRNKPYLHTDGLIYSPVYVDRSELKRAEDANNQNISVELDSQNPIAQLFKNGLPGREITLQIFRIQKGVTSGGNSVNLFTGSVASVKFNDDKALLECQPLSALLNKRMLRMYYQYQCNHYLFDPLCSLQAETWSDFLVVTDIQSNGAVLVFNSMSRPDGYYNAGLVEKDDKWIAITGHDSATGRIKLLFAMDGLAIGDTVRLTKGCERTRASCDSFNNSSNFFGFTQIPNDNPFINGLKA